MDLIYMNSDYEDIGVLQNYSFDLAFGEDENNFECRIAQNQHCCEPNYYLYIEGTEYGGCIDAISVDTAAADIVYSGRTWHGILNSKILEPDAGEDYLILSGEANTVLGTLITRMGLNSLFSADTSASGITITNYAMNRYIAGYDGIRKMLKSVGAKLAIQYENGSVVLSAVPLVDYTTDEEFDSDIVDFTARKSVNTVNHLICLGQGDLAARTVIHLYADVNGNISTTQTQTGLAEYVAVYDYPNIESAEELQQQGIDYLKSLWEPDELQISLDSSDDVYDVSDIVGASDNITGITVKAAIVKKIINIVNDVISISYEVGE